MRGSDQNNGAIGGASRRQLPVWPVRLDDRGCRSSGAAARLVRPHAGDFPKMPLRRERFARISPMIRRRQEGADRISIQGHEHQADGQQKVRHASRGHQTTAHRQSGPWSAAAARVAIRIDCHWVYQTSPCPLGRCRSALPDRARCAVRLPSPAPETLWRRPPRCIPDKLCLSPHGPDNCLLKRRVPAVLADGCVIFGR